MNTNYKNVIIRDSIFLHSKDERRNKKCRMLGIKNCRFYDLRGSYATTNIRNGVEIRDMADILGQKNIETTENF